MAGLQLQSSEPLRDGILATVIGGLVVAVILALFRRRQPVPSWAERKAALNEQIRVCLRQVIDARTPLIEDKDLSYDQRKIKESDRARLYDQSSKAMTEIKGILDEFRYILAPRVTEIIEAFFATLTRDLDDTTAPSTVIVNITRDALRDLEEFLPADVGPDRGIRWRLQRFHRWRYLQWLRLKGSAKNFLWRLNWWFENLALVTGPKLTQDHVRNPPLWSHRQTVEQMEASGYSRLSIQRQLHEQLATDPPPWLPVPLTPLDHPRERSPRLHDERLGPLKTGDAADVCAHGVPLTKACRPCGFVVLPKDFVWGSDLPEEYQLPNPRLARRYLKRG